MSSEQINVDQLETPKMIETNMRNKVDINLLMARVRQEEKVKKKQNFVFVSLIGSVLVFTGIIASL